MLKSDRDYLAKFALDPEMEDRLDDLDSYFDDEMDRAEEDHEIESLIEGQIELEEWGNEDQTIKRPGIGCQGKRRTKERRRDHHPRYGQGETPAG